MSIYSIGDALSKTLNKDKSNKPVNSSPNKSSCKGTISTISELSEGDETKSDDKPIRRTVSFTNSVSVFGENEENMGDEPSSSPKKIKRTRSSERFNPKDRRRSSVLSNR